MWSQLIEFALLVTLLSWIWFPPGWLFPRNNTPQSPTGADIPVGQLTPEQAQAMLDRLIKYHGGAVAPVDEYCRVLFAYHDAIGQASRDETMPDDYRKAMRDQYDQILKVRMSATKSNLLHRLLYQGEALRTKKCPQHKGRWSGIDFSGRSTCGCSDSNGNLTGWLKDS